MASFGSVQPVQYVPSTYGSLSATPESVMPVAIVPGSGIYARPSARPSQSVPLPPNTPNRWDLPNYNSRASRKDDTAIAALSVLLAGGGLAAGVFLLSRRKGADHPVPPPTPTSVLNAARPPQPPMPAAPPPPARPPSMQRRRAPATPPGRPARPARPAPSPSLQRSEGRRAPEVTASARASVDPGPTLSSLLELPEFHIDRFAACPDPTDTASSTTLNTELHGLFHQHQGATSDCGLFASRAALGGRGRVPGQRAQYGALAECISGAAGNRYLSPSDLMAWHNAQVARMNAQAGSEFVHDVDVSNFALDLGCDKHGRGTIGGVERSRSALFCHIRNLLVGIDDLDRALPAMVDYIIVPAAFANPGTEADARAGRDVSGGNVATHWVTLKYDAMTKKGYRIDSLGEAPQPFDYPHLGDNRNGLANMLTSHIATSCPQAINPHVTRQEFIAIPVLHPVVRIPR